MDFIEGLTHTILVVVCHLTKMALFIPTFHDVDAEDLACIFLSQVFTNMAPQLTSSRLAQALHLLLLEISLSVARDQSQPLDCLPPQD